MSEINCITPYNPDQKLAIYDVTVEHLDTGEQFTVRAGLLTKCPETGGHGAQIKVGFWLDDHFGREHHYRTFGYTHVHQEHEIANEGTLKSYKTRIKNPI